MANYNTHVKIIKTKVDTRDDNVNGSAAKKLNDFLETLDDTTEKVQQMTCSFIGSNTLIYTIWYLGG